MDRNNHVNEAVLELIDIARVESPYAGHLVERHRRRLVGKLLKSGKLDASTADYLLG